MSPAAARLCSRLAGHRWLPHPRLKHVMNDRDTTLRMQSRSGKTDLSQMTVFGSTTSDRYRVPSS